MSAQAMSRSDANTDNAIVTKVAEKYSIDSETLLQTLKSTAFKQSGDKPITNEQMVALLIVSDQYNLNPFTKEIYAFPDKSGGIVPVVSVDGWNRIANEHPYFDGIEFEYSKDVVKPEGSQTHCHAWIEAILFRKDRKHPVRVREYLDECYRLPFIDRDSGYVSQGPWQTHPKRLLRHKSLIQCYRVGFAFVGIYDEDEALRIVNENLDDSIVDTQANTSNQASAKVVSLPQKQASQTEATDDTFDKKVMDEFIARLVQRSKKTNQWSAANDLIDERYKGSANTYAKQQLAVEKKVCDDIQVDKTDESNAVIPEESVDEISQSQSDVVAEIANAESAEDKPFF